MPRPSAVVRYAVVTRFTAVVLASGLLVSGCTAAGSDTSYDGTRDATHDVGVQLFQWNWDSIARECTDTLGPAGIAWVLTSPPQEHITGPEWWTSYQPVSYAIESRLGTREQLSAMVATCHEAHVAVIADAVINHMSGQDDGGVGWAKTEFEHYEYPDLYTRDDFHDCGLSDNNDITDYSDAEMVQACELVNLADLATEKSSVRDTIVAYLNDLRSLGVDGFRIDAAKHIPADDVKAIVDAIDGDPYIVSEVIRGGGEPIQPEDYVESGDVFEFAFARQLKSWIDSGQLDGLSDVDAYGYLDSGVARTFVENHDTERNKQTLSYVDGDRYRLANVMLLATDYGSPVLYSGYAFSNPDDGLPVDSEGAVRNVECAVPSDSTALSGGYSDGAWVCQHRWALGMVGWRAATSGDTVVDEWSEGDAWAFGRGETGFVAMNAGDAPLTHTFTTSLPDGEYCDVARGSLVDGACTGETITVRSGALSVTLDPFGARAIHVDARL